MDTEVRLRITAMDASGNQMVNTIAPAFIVEQADVRMLNVQSTGASRVRITSNPSEYRGRTDYSRTAIPDGTGIILTAPARKGRRHFASWSGCDSTDDIARTCTVAMSEDKTVSANYILWKKLRVIAPGARKVEISSDPPIYGGTSNYTRKRIPEGTSITLTAPATGQRGSRIKNFSHWIGCDSTDTAARTCTVMMSKSRRVKARYKR